MINKVSKNNKYTKRKLSMLSLSVLMALASPLQAAENDEIADAGNAQSQEESNNEGLEKITVTARKRSENIQEVPVAVSVFNANSIKNLSISSTADIAMHTPSLQVSSGSQGGSSTQFFIRGIGQLDFISTLDPGVGVYLDGVYIARTAGALLDLSNIERIEVLRGPQGALFGKNTIGGAINLITKRAHDELRGSATITKGQRNRTNIQGEVSLPISDVVRASLAYSSKQQDGFGTRLIANLDPNTAEFQPILGTSETGDENSTVIYGSLEWDVSDSLNIHLSTDKTRVRERQDHYILQAVNLDEGTLPAVSNNFVRNNLDPSRIPFEIYDERYITDDPYTTYAGNDAGNQTDIFGLSMTTKWNIREDLDFKAILAYRDLDTNTGVDFDVSPIEFFDQTVSLQQDQTSLELQLDGVSLNDKFQWLVGMFYMKENIDSTIRLNLSHGEDFVDAPFDVIEKNPIEITSFAIFSQVTYALTDHLSVTGGLRFTEDKKVLNYSHELAKLPGEFLFEPGFGVLDEKWNDVSPKISLEYITDDNYLFYGSVTKGFKSGAFNGRAFTAEDTAPADPETVISYEVGTKMDLLDDTLRVNAALFRAEYQDIQTTVCLNSGVCVVTNAAESVIQGLELEITYLATDKLAFDLGVSILDDEYVDLDEAEGTIPEDADLIQTPDFTVNLGITYEFTESIIARVDYFRTDEFYHNPANGEFDFEPAYDLINARITYYSEGDWQASIYGLNLGETVYAEYREDLTGFGTSEAFIGAPREIGVEVTFEF